MSEPARAFPAHEDDNQAAPAPLRDWLAALQRYETEERGRIQAPAADNSPWGPRLVQPEPIAQLPAESADSADISELMAENLMLKAKLQVEHDRQDALQSALAEQIRELREHIAQEMSSLEEMRAEQEAAQAEYGTFCAERELLRRDRDMIVAERDSARTEQELLRRDRDTIVAERDAARAERDELATERDGLREDCDLWRARAEALALPLFQTTRTKAQA